MTYGLKKEKGFIRNHQKVRDNCYWNTRRNACRVDINRAFLYSGVHKRSGWSRGLNAKQFDTSRRNYCKHFGSKKSVADLVRLPQIVWGFGQNKFAFRP